MAAGVEVDVLPHPELLVDAEEVRHVAEVPADLSLLAGDRGAANPGLACRHGQQRRQHPQRGRLPGSVWPDQTVHRASRHPERKVSHRGHAAEPLAETVCLEREPVTVHCSLFTNHSLAPSSDRSSCCTTSSATLGSTRTRIAPPSMNEAPNGTSTTPLDPIGASTHVLSAQRSSDRRTRPGVKAAGLALFGLALPSRDRCTLRRSTRARLTFGGKSYWNTIGPRMPKADGSAPRPRAAPSRIVRPSRPGGITVNSSPYWTGRSCSTSRVAAPEIATPSATSRGGVAADQANRTAPPPVSPSPPRPRSEANRACRWSS